MKNVLVIQGGGRPRGNTAQLVESFVKGVTEAGHQAEIVSLIKNEVKGCLGYNACRYGKPCIQKDGFNGLVPKIKEADLIVFASPLYFGQYRQELRHLLRGFTVLRKKMEIRLSDAMRNIPSKTVRF